MTPFVLQNDRLYQAGKPLPVKDGIITAVVEGRERRYVKEKFIQYLNNNRLLTVHLPKPKVVKTWTKRNERKQRTNSPRSGNGVKVFKDGVCVDQFISITRCAKAIRKSKATISRIIRGEQENTTGYTFELIQ